MASVNKTITVGRLGKKAEIRQTPTGKKVASFSLATSEYSKDTQGNKQERTEWINFTAWGFLADLIEKYTDKGSEIYVEGKLTTRSWDDQQGQKKYRTEILASSIQLLGGRSGNQSQQNDDYGQVPDSENLPF